MERLIRNRAVSPVKAAASKKASSDECSAVNRTTERLFVVLLLEAER